MSNRLFQSVIHQMKDAVGGRIIGVIDETGVIIACSELVKIGEVRQSIRDEMAYSADMIVTGGCTYRPLTNGTKREYITFVEGEDAEADMISRLLAVSLSNIKNLYDEKYDKGSFIKNVCWTISCPPTFISSPRNCISTPRSAALCSSSSSSARPI